MNGLNREALTEAVFAVVERYNLPLTNNEPYRMDGVWQHSVGDFIEDLLRAYAARASTTDDLSAADVTAPHEDEPHCCPMWNPETSRHEARRYVAAAPAVEPDELWSCIDWALWGAGLGDTLREPIADAAIRAMTPEQHQQAIDAMARWKERRGETVIEHAYRLMKAGELPDPTAPTVSSDAGCRSQVDSDLDWMEQDVELARQDERRLEADFPGPSSGSRLAQWLRER